ncbi:MAG: hypothetical protein H6Q68_2655, partial [Firmicutes bacterium]|nr:hypothetical protein [Bacillota bacterium]
MAIFSFIWFGKTMSFGACQSLVTGAMTRTFLLAIS